MRVRTLLNPFKCNTRFQQQRWDEHFTSFNNVIDVEIGFGNGKFIESYAEQNSSRHIVGFEIRQKHVALVQEKIVQKKLSNALAFRAHGKFGLEDMFTDGSVERIFVFHPDPWLKQNQQKRRIIHADFLAIAHQKLNHAGKLYIATDVPTLWEYMLTSIQASGLFELVDDDLFWQTQYHTRWKEMSLDHQRNLFYGTFVKINP